VSGANVSFENEIDDANGNFECNRTCENDWISEPERTDCDGVGLPKRRTAQPTATRVYISPATPSHVFEATIVGASRVFVATARFTASVPFTRAATKTRLGGRAGTLLGGSTGPMIVKVARDLGGLIVLPTVIVLLYMFKKKTVVDAADEVHETSVDDVDHENSDRYTSEYDLTDDECDHHFREGDELTKQVHSQTNQEHHVTQSNPNDFPDVEMPEME
jgi:hypothetical protein